MNVIVSSTPMRSSPSSDACLETECLFGEKLEILDNFKEFVYCKLLTDNYHGWVEKKSLGYSNHITHRVLSIRSYVLKEKDVKSNYLYYLPLGSRLHVKSIEDEWAEILVPQKNNTISAYLPTNHIIEINKRVKDWVSIAEELVGTPYKWGGRDSKGLDCSALLQLSYENNGEIIPRNTMEQRKIKKKIITDINKLERGCVVFWDGHVGIMVDKKNCLHSNAFHMKTVIEPIEKINLRNGDKNKIILLLDLNS